MLERVFLKTGINLLKKSLDAAAFRHKVIAGNIANVETPGYKRRDVVFEEELQESIHSNSIEGRITNPKHIPIGRRAFETIQPRIITDQSPELDSGVNNVDIDLEMAELAKNQMQFAATATVIARKFKALQKAIRGRA